MASRKHKKSNSGQGGRAKPSPANKSRPVTALPKAVSKTRDPAIVRPVLSRRKTWLFRFVAGVIIPVCLLAGLEMVLRVSGVGYNADAILTYKQGGKTLCYSNPKFAWRFFSPHLARESEPFMFPSVKPDKTCRIFVLGASAAMGVPEPTFAFSRMLDVMLHHAYPGWTFEVINTGITAINSHAVLEIAKDCAVYQPDIYLVYLGNNEVTGPYGAGSVFTPFSGSLPMIRASIAVKGTRLGQWAAQQFGALGSKTSAPKMWRGLEMFKGHQVRQDNPALQGVYDHFQRNLEDIVSVGQKHGAQVVLCTVGSNLKGNAPFSSQHRPDLSDADARQWQALYDQGVGHEDNEEMAQAVTCYLQAADLDDTFADLHFRLGRCYETLEDYEAASTQYIQARELDTLRFRADSHINDIIRHTADSAGQGMILADIDRTLAAHSDHGIPGDALFYEHVHMNFTGNYLAAQAIMTEIDKALPESIQKSRSDPVSVMTEDECARCLAYTAWDRYGIADIVLNRFIKKPPFNTRVYADAQIEDLEADLARLRRDLTRSALAESASQYAWAIEQRKADWVLHWKYGRLLTEGMKEYRAAAQQFQIMQTLLPMSWLSHGSLASVTNALGDSQGAIALYQRALELNPISGSTHYYLGDIWHKKGQLDNAEAHYRKAIEWAPDCIPAYTALMRILMGQKQLDKAVEIGRHGLVYSPDSTALLGSVGTLLARTGHIKEALEAYQAGLKIDPNDASIRNSLKILREESKGRL